MRQTRSRVLGTPAPGDARKSPPPFLAEDSCSEGSLSQRDPLSHQARLLSPKPPKKSGHNARREQIREFMGADRQELIIVVIALVYGGVLLFDFATEGLVMARWRVASQVQRGAECSISRSPLTAPTPSLSGGEHWLLVILSRGRRLAPVLDRIHLLQIHSSFHRRGCHRRHIGDGNQRPKCGGNGESPDQRVPGV